MCHFIRFLTEEEGTTAIESSLIISVIGLGTITTMESVGEQLAALFSYIALTLQQAIA
jgi:Flp pilus assembly pilin Flp